MTLEDHKSATGLAMWFTVLRLILHLRTYQTRRTLLSQKLLKF